MYFSYQPQTSLEHFGVQVYNLLVDKFPQTYFVGGMVRDTLLQRTITDIDIATNARPQEVALILQNRNVAYTAMYRQFGVIVANPGPDQVEITTLRRDLPSNDRYPAVEFIDSIAKDSRRRDFTINALYLSLNDNKIYDFHNGLIDLLHCCIRCIGDPQLRFAEDPLRVVRALRFAAQLNFSLSRDTKRAIIILALYLILSLLIHFLFSAQEF